MRCLPALLAGLGIGGAACAFDLPEPGSAPLDVRDAAGDVVAIADAGGEAGEGGSSSSSGDAFCAGKAALFCEDFHGTATDQWTLGVERTGSGEVKVESDGRLTANMAAYDGDPPEASSKARLVTRVDLPAGGLRVELDVLLHRSGPTENYAIFEANFEQSTDPKTQSLSVYDDDDYLALSAQTPTFSSNPKAAPLPTGVWLHLVFDMHPDATNGSSILSFRERDHPEAPLVERSRLTNLEFLVDQAPRRARLYLGLARYRLNTPALSIEYDNFLVTALP